MSKHVLIAPISGGHFPGQLASMIKLCDRNYIPDLTLASSGGTVATYVSSAANWRNPQVKVISNSLSHQLFIKSWLPIDVRFFPSPLAGIFFGALYKSSDLITKFFWTFFTKDKIVKDEIWVAAINKRTGGVCMFCNKTKDDALIKGDHFLPEMVKSESLCYLDGDIDLISKSVMASSSIPVLVSPQIIGENEYIDCGAKFASPLIPLREEIRSIGKDGLHIIYVNGYNLQKDLQVNTCIDNEVCTSHQNIIQNGQSATDHFVRGLVIHDRVTAYALIREKGEVHNISKPISSLQIIISKRRLISYSLLEIYPQECHVIDVVSFTGRDVTDAIAFAEKKLQLIFWWVGPPDLFEDCDFPIA